MDFVEVLPVQFGSKFSIALNTPMDQIPLTVAEARTLLASLEAAIWTAENRQPEGEIA
jgi:hypothetical protein